jgi:UDP-N-acetylglucosamine diphosphorylase/glucosamine-1-phosphate N-acetyltransferase
MTMIPVCIYEDDGFADLLPLTYTRPVYDLRCGMRTLQAKTTACFPDSKISLHCRDYLQDVVAERNPGTAVNTAINEKCLFINGRFIFRNFGYADTDRAQECLFVADDQVAACLLNPDTSAQIDWSRPVPVQINDFPDLPVVAIEGFFIRYPWDLITANESQIEQEFNLLATAGEEGADIHAQAVKLNPDGIHIGSNSTIMPGVVLDAHNGPVFIGNNVKVMPHAYIQGPVFIGNDSLVKPSSKIYGGTSVGEVCKIGGEIEESILYAFSNKQHDGFLGHAYIGEWVNIGAGTTNSDLKNNYGTIKVPCGSRLIDSGQQFVGLFMADHAKAGINTMFNAGTVVGTMSVIFGHGFPPKDIPSFCWGGSEGLVEHQIDKAIDTAAKVMARRNRTMNSAEIELFQSIFRMSDDERRSKI